MRRDNPALLWSVAVAMPLAMDAYLVRRGRHSLSHHARTHKKVTAAIIIYFGLHIYAPPSWRPADPLSVAAHFIRPLGVTPR